MSSPKQFAKVAAVVWSSKRFRLLTEGAKLLLLYLMTCRHQNSCGAFRAPVGYLAVDLEWSVERIEGLLASLVEVGLIEHDPEENEMYVKGWYRFNPPMNPSHVSGTKKLLDEINSPRIAELARAEFQAAFDDAVEPVDHGSHLTSRWKKPR